MTTTHSAPSTNVVSIFTGRPLSSNVPRTIRLAPELDGLEILYSNDNAPNKLFSMKILCWGLRENGEVVGMVPWLNDITAAVDISDPLNGHWAGYYDPALDSIFYAPPTHKIVELQSAAEYYGYEEECDCDAVVQEIPDSIGTHAVLTMDGFRRFMLIEVESWRLYGDGRVAAMLINENQIQSTPVLPGDPCLFEAQSHPDFRYFFQHRIANKIKERDPETLAAISSLIDD